MEAQYKWRQLRMALYDMDNKYEQFMAKLKSQHQVRPEVVAEMDNKPTEVTDNNAASKPGPFIEKSE